jgi:hypothetical protein
MQRKIYPSVARVLTGAGWAALVLFLFLGVSLPARITKPYVSAIAAPVPAYVRGSICAVLSSPGYCWRG